MTNYGRLALLTLSLATAGWAQPHYAYNVGLTTSHYTYKEPGVSGPAFAQYSGSLYGVFANSTVTLDRTYLESDITLTTGRLHYTSATTGKLGGVVNNTVELRAVGGYQLTPFLTPYIGVGYRYLANNSEGRVTDNGYNGYDRQSAYTYSPVGVQIRQGNDQWSFVGKAEYDFLWSGKQVSGLPGGDVTNRQKNGHGARGSLHLVRIGTRWDIFVEPFLVYWSIADSDWVILGDYRLQEPKNTTKEVGVRFGISF